MHNPHLTLYAKVGTLCLHKAKPLAKKDKMRPDNNRESLPKTELERRVIYSLMLAMVRLAKTFQVSLEEAQGLLQMAYFSELRKDGLKLREIADILDVSPRSVARLSKQLKSNFFRPEREHNLPRRILFMLWSEPMSQARITRELDDVDSELVTSALKGLQESGRITLNSGRVETFSTTRDAERMVLPGWTSRIGALNSLAGNVSSVIFGRFFEERPSAFARTLSFRLRRVDLPKLNELYEQEIWPRLEALDASGHDDEALAMNLSICWSELDTIPSRQPKHHSGEEQ